MTHAAITPPAPGARTAQRGVALVYAIFIIVAVALAVVTMNRWLGTQTVSQTLALQRARALQAANAGVEWGVNRVQTLADCPAAVSTLSLTDGALNGFTVALTCARVGPLTEGSDTFNWYTLTARASSGNFAAGTDFVSRQVRVNMAN